MKYYLVCIPMLIIMASACKKINLEPDPIINTDHPRTIQVLEAVTSKPIANATVILEKCDESSIDFGCSKHSTIRTLTTNGEGKATFTSPSNLARIQIQHINYWTVWEESTGFVTYTLTPKCTIKASIKKVRNYSPDDILNISIRDSSCFSFDCWSNDYRLGLPIDTTVYFKAQGYKTNQVSWYINYLSTDTLHPVPAVYISGFDTANVTIEY